MNGGSTGGAEARQGGDLFDSAVTFEEDHISQGYAEGVRWAQLATPCLAEPPLSA